MSDDLIPFSFDGHSLRVVVRDGDPWFVAADACRVLDIGNPSDALRRLDDDERTLVSIEGGPPAGTNVVSESGLYSLVLGSRKPEAKAFKRWIVRQVIPSIRKTGGYGASDERAMLAALSDPASLRTLLGNYAERVIQLQADVAERESKIAADAPKVAFADRVAITEELVGVREAAKLLRVSERELVHTLIDKGIAQRLTKRLAVTHLGQIVRGYVDEKLDEWTDDEGTSHSKPRCMITPKGLAWLERTLRIEAA